ncbi:MAG: hypothetical protein A3E87_07015 [Gammaproteobacteria bacterium RIFCSPHIGHO2_12_FULL_35_23]|nr:MAG: hypothetical protein A3E87_07015 [Gammaproteobacteria bacterium RIFCSPHIGHO2_12_FULL_35_23]
MKEKLLSGEKFTKLLAIDFDGTLFEEGEPNGGSYEYWQEWFLELQQEQVKVIIITQRTKTIGEEAVNAFLSRIRQADLPRVYMGCSMPKAFALEYLHNILVAEESDCELMVLLDDTRFEIEQIEAGEFNGLYGIQIVIGRVASYQEFKEKIVGVAHSHFTRKKPSTARLTFWEDRIVGLSDEEHEAEVLGPSDNEGEGLDQATSVKVKA